MMSQNDHGKKIENLGALGDWYKQTAAATPQAAKRYRMSYVEEGLQFLNKKQAMVMPVGEYDKYITVRDSWVFIRGHMPTEEDNPDNEQRKAFNRRMRADKVALRFLVNALAMRSRVLLLDPMTEQIFRYFRAGRRAHRHYLATADAFRLTLHVLYLVKNGYKKPVDAVDQGYLETVYQSITNPATAGSTDIYTVRDKSLNTLNNIKSNIYDPEHIVESLVSNRWIIMSEPTYEDDGWVHLLSLPSWLFGMEFDHNNNVVWNERYTGHRIDRWAYYHIPYKPEPGEPEEGIPNEEGQAVGVGGFSGQAP